MTDLAAEVTRPPRTAGGGAAPRGGSVASERSSGAGALAEYRPTHKVRFVTAASLFDGHDAAINIMRRILQGMGA